ncbi:catenin alpha-2-like [Panthera onca]
MVTLNYVAARRQQELKDPHCRNEMAAARGALKKNATMLYTASQAFLCHPDVAATRANRDYVFKQVQEAIAGISNAAQATSPTDEAKGHTGIGELAAVLNEFDEGGKHLTLRNGTVGKTFFHLKSGFIKLQVFEYACGA